MFSLSQVLSTVHSMAMVTAILAESFDSRLDPALSSALVKLRSPLLRISLHLYLTAPHLGAQCRNCLASVEGKQTLV